MLEVYYQIAQLADRYGLSSEVDDIDRRMVRVSQVAPVGLSTQQYIQDIYRRIANLATQIQQMQQAQNSSAPAKRNGLQGAIANFDTMQDQSLQMHSNNPLNLEIEHNTA